VDLGTAVASAWSSGISVYAVAAILGIGGRLDWVDSPAFLQRPWVIVAAVALFVVELIVDKISYVDSTWDAVHTVIRPAAGALLLDSSDVSGATVGLALGGATLALLAHGAKASARVLVNLSPEPASNVVVSTSEDGLVAGLMAFALAWPELAFGITIALAILCAIFLFFVARRMRRLFRARRAGTVRARDRRRRATPRDHGRPDH
jgi:hypothetical protein